MAGTDLTYAQAPLADRMNWARAISGAGTLVPAGFRDPNGQPNPAKILLAAEYGAMIGLHPMAALTGINVIDGKPSPSPALMSALVRSAGHKLRIETTGTWSAGDYQATATLVRADDPKHPFTETWDKGRAERAGLIPQGQSKSAWSRYPESMCKWRAVSAVCRDGAEDVLLGAHYVPEELGAEVNEAGEMIDVTDTVRDVTTEPDPESQVPRAPARGRKPSATAPGNPDEDQFRDREAVVDMWVTRINDATTMDTLIHLRADVVKIGSAILDYADTDGHTVDQWFVRRRTELQQAQAGEPDTHLSNTLTDYPEDSDVPF